MLPLQSFTGIQHKNQLNCHFVCVLCSSSFACRAPLKISIWLLRGFASKVPRATKNTTFKNQLTNFLRDENHLCGIILVHLASNVALKTRKHLLVAGYRILKKLLKLKSSPNEAAHGHHFTPQQQTH